MSPSVFAKIFCILYSLPQQKANAGDEYRSQCRKMVIDGLEALRMADARSDLAGIILDPFTVRLCVTNRRTERYRRAKKEAGAVPSATTVPNWQFSG